LKEESIFSSYGKKASGTILGTEKDTKIMVSKGEVGGNYCPAHKEGGEGKWGK